MVCVTHHLAHEVTFKLAMKLRKNSSAGECFVKENNIKMETVLSTTVKVKTDISISIVFFPGFIGKRLYKVSLTSSRTSVYNAIKKKKTLC